MIDVKKWLVEDMGFTADEANELAGKFEGRSDKLESGFLRLSDYSKRMNDLKKLQDDYAAKDTKLTEDMAEWAEMTAAEKAKNGDLRKQIDDAKAAMFTLEQKAIRLAEEAGVDPKTILGTEPVKEPVKEKVVEFDLTPVRDQIGGVANYLLDLVGAVDEIAEQHQALTGKRFNRKEFIDGIKADIAANKKGVELNPFKRWEAQFDIPKLRTEADITARKAEGDRRFEEGRQAAMTEAALPGGSPKPGTHSPVFKTSNVAAGSKLKRDQPSDRLSGAVAALSTGKYRTPQTKAS